jgi:NADH-quinone oxidoreductase subunit A
MPSLLDQYLPLAVFMAVAAAISGALLLAPFLVAFKAPDPEKLSAYECGFNAFDDARMQFDVMMIFLGVLTIGFAYEWKKGALEWD